MACAMIETVVDIIESEGLLANVRKLSRQIRETCVVGPVIATQGAGFLLGLRTRRLAKDVQQELLARDILAGTSGDPGASAGCVNVANTLLQEITKHPIRFYVNIHTSDFPDGALRGQLHRAPRRR